MPKEKVELTKEEKEAILEKAVVDKRKAEEIEARLLPFQEELKDLARRMVEAGCTLSIERANVNGATIIFDPSRVKGYFKIIPTR